MDYSKIWSRFIDGWELRSVASLCLAYLFGDYNAAMGALIVLWLLDWITKWYAISRRVGSFKQAWITDAISSRGMREGLHKTVWYIVFLIVARQLEQFSILGYTLGRSATEAAGAYLALIEAKSIMENLRDAGWGDSAPIISALDRKQEQTAGQVAGLSVYQAGVRPAKNSIPKEGEP